LSGSDDLALPRAIRALRNDLRSTLDLLEESTTRRGWWEALKARERDIARCFSELRAERPTTPDAALPLTDPHAFDDEGD
jgi:hypothetical protein